MPDRLGELIQVLAEKKFRGDRTSMTAREGAEIVAHLKELEAWRADVDAEERLQSRFDSPALVSEMCPTARRLRRANEEGPRG